MSEPKKVLMVVTSCDRINGTYSTGIWFEEFAIPYVELKSRGFDITVVSPLGGKAPLDAIFLPGGHGTMFDLPENPLLQKLLADFAQADKAIAAVCHGPVALINVVGSDGTPLIAGKRITAFTNEEEVAVQLDKLMPFLLETKLRELGSQFVAHPNFSDHIERDGKLITGQNPQSSKSVALALIEAMKEVI